MGTRMATFTILAVHTWVVAACATVALLDLTSRRRLGLAPEPGPLALEVSKPLIAADPSPEPAVFSISHVRREAFERIVSDATAGARSSKLRIIPFFENDQPVGFKVYGVRPDSSVAMLGLQNGDVIREINGRSLITESAYELATLLDDPLLDISITRGSWPGRLIVVIGDAPPAA